MFVMFTGDIKLVALQVYWEVMLSGCVFLHLLVCPNSKCYERICVELLYYSNKMADIKCKIAPCDAFSLKLYGLNFTTHFTAILILY